MSRGARWAAVWVSAALIAGCSGTSSGSNPPAPAAASSSPAASATPSPAPTATSSTHAAPTAPPPKPGLVAGMQAFETRVFESLNSKRVEVGCQPLLPAKSLVATAGWQAQDMVKRHYFSQTPPSGPGWMEQAATRGWDGGDLVMLIAHGNDQPFQVLDTWMNDLDSRRLMLTCLYRFGGVGYVNGTIRSSYSRGSWALILGG